MMSLLLLQLCLVLPLQRHESFGIEHFIKLEHMDRGMLSYRMCRVLTNLRSLSYTTATYFHPAYQGISVLWILSQVDSLERLL